MALTFKVPVGEGATDMSTHGFLYELCDVFQLSSLQVGTASSVVSTSWCISAKSSARAHKAYLDRMLSAKTIDRNCAV